MDTSKVVHGDHSLYLNKRLRIQSGGLTHEGIMMGLAGERKIRTPTGSRVPWVLLSDDRVSHYFLPEDWKLEWVRL
jgi:hypothetical protein